MLIYGKKSTERSTLPVALFAPFNSTIASACLQAYWVYLDELGDLERLPLGVAAMVLTITDEAEAAEKARLLIERANREAPSLPIKQGIIEIVSTIMVYKFTNLSRQELESMLGTKLEETRVYREAREEERQAIAVNLLKQGFPMEAISQATGLTLEQLQQLQAENQ